jgi:hypothetical protein
MTDVFRTDVKLRLSPLRFLGRARLSGSILICVSKFANLALFHFAYNRHYAALPEPVFDARYLQRFLSLKNSAYAAYWQRFVGTNSIRDAQLAARWIIGQIKHIQIAAATLIFKPARIGKRSEYQLPVKFSVLYHSPLAGII